MSVVPNDNQERVNFSEVARDMEMPDLAIGILMAAMGLFARKGYAATSVREIVQEAKVTNPMLYYYFGNKEGVFHKLIEILFGQMNKFLHEILVQDVSIEERITRLVRLHLEAIVESPTALRFVYAVMFGPPDSRPNIDLVSMRRPINREIERMFQEAIDEGSFLPHAGRTAEQLTYRLLGLVNQHMMFSLKYLEQLQNDDTTAQEINGELTCPQAIEELVGFFFHGAGHSTKEPR